MKSWLLKLRKRWQCWWFDFFWGFLVVTWIMATHPRQMRSIIDQTEGRTLTWLDMWDKTPEQAEERAQQIFHVLFLARFRDRLHPDWVANLESSIPFNHLTWASE